jgi:hypothetical protein
MSSKILKVTVSWKVGDESYSIKQSETTITETMLEIARKAMSGLRKATPKHFNDSRIAFTFYVNEHGEHYPFFFGFLLPKSKIIDAK